MTSVESMDRKLELTERRKKVLDDLFRAGRISQLTYEYLNRGLSEAVAVAPPKETTFRRVTPAPASPGLVEKLPEAPADEAVKEPIGAPKIDAEKPAKGVTIETAKRKRKRVGERKGRLKKKRTKRTRSKRVKEAPTTEVSSGRVHPRGVSGMRCRNPWNGRCKSTDIEVSIYYKDEFLPICRACWHEIADKGFTW